MRQRDGLIASYRFDVLKSIYEFPFEFKEIRKASNEIDIYNFVSSTNEVETIRIREVEDPTYRLVLGELENELHLFTPTEENHVVVQTGLSFMMMVILKLEKSANLK